MVGILRVPHILLHQPYTNETILKHEEKVKYLPICRLKTME